MKVTLGKIMQMEGPMHRLAQISTMPCSTTFRVAMLARKIVDTGGPTKQAYNAAIVKYGKLDEKTQNWTVTPENKEAFASEMNEFLAQEVEIDANPIQLPGDTKGLSASDLMALDPFIVLREDPPMKMVSGGKKKDVV